MGASRVPGPLGALTSDVAWERSRLPWQLETRALTCPAPPGALDGSRQSQPPAAWQSREVEKSIQDSVTTSVAMLSWDGFVRAHVYDPAARAFSQQGEEFVRLGSMSHHEAATWVNAQRNALLIHVRDQHNSPLGRAYAELKKPRDRLPSLEGSLARQRAKFPNATETELYEAVIRSGGKTNTSVNRMSVAFRMAGPALLVVDIAVSAHLVMSAPREARGRVAAREAGGLVGAGLGGWGGAKAGCWAGAGVGVWFKGVGAAPGCLVGAVGGALGLGYAGSEIGSSAGEMAWDAAETTLRWVE